MSTKLRFRNFPVDRIEWVTSSFLILTGLTTLFVVPWFLWTHTSDPAIDWSVVWWSFAAMYCATGLSITLGYHRLFSHLAFRAAWPVKFATLILGASAFENSALDWSHDHRLHHKHVDEHDDPYDISKGFFYAHIGWLLFKLKPKPPLDCVKDLMSDPLVMWQHRWVQVIGVVVGLAMPFGAGYLLGGMPMAWAMLLIPGVLRITAVHHSTFCINSLCHTIGDRPYDSQHTPRDSWICALITFGEGYHNYHHTFQHDYRNGVKWWQFDPTKWSIWLLSKIGLASHLRTAPDARILVAEMTEMRRALENGLVARVSDSPRLAAKIRGWRAVSGKLSTQIDELSRLVTAGAALPRKRVEAMRHDIAEAGRIVAKLKIARDCA